jgi:putative proteasome-type protease
MVSTARANLSVGPPYDAAFYRNDSLALTELRIEPDSPYIVELDSVWQRYLLEAIHHLPAVSAEALADGSI